MFIILLFLIFRLIVRSGLRISHSKVFSSEHFFSKPWIQNITHCACNFIFDYLLKEPWKFYCDLKKSFLNYSNFFILYLVSKIIRSRHDPILCGTPCKKSRCVYPPLKWMSSHFMLVCLEYNVKLILQGVLFFSWIIFYSKLYIIRYLT